MSFLNISKTMLGCALMITLSTGCMTTRIASEDLTPEQRKMREQAQAYNKTVGQGIGIGALAGGLLMAALGGDGEDIAAGAAVGGAVGGIAGSYYAEKQKEYASEEDALDSMISDARDYNQESRRLIATAEQVCEKQTRKLADLKRQLDAGQDTKKALRKEIRIARADKRIIEESLASTQEEMEKYQKAMARHQKDFPGSDVSEFEDEIAVIGERVEELETLSQQLAESIEASAS